MKKYLLVILFLVSFVFAQSENRRLFQQHYTFETENFILNYERGLDRSAREIATILERLHSLFRDKYGITLPTKTTVLVANSAFSGGWALAIQNTIGIYVNDFDWNMRGTPDWLEMVVAHEYAHIVSIANSFKMPSWMPYFQTGFFNHPNEKFNIEAMHIFPSEVMPPWFFEGVAQFESMVSGGERWDSHRDMIMRTLTLNNALLSWDRMQVFTGRADDFEKVYNHGFSLVKYIAETYGEDKLLAITRESARFGRLVFDNAIRSVLGISGRQLYENWKMHLKRKYTAQVENLGELTEDKKLTEAGFNNFFARFSNDGERILFLSNAGSESFFRMLHELEIQIDSADTNIDIRLIAPQINNAFSLDNEGNAIFMSAASLRSRLPHNQGGGFVFDIHRAVLPSDTTRRALRESIRGTEQLTFRQNLQNPVFSPDGQQIAAVLHDRDRHFLVIGNADGSDFREVYPPRNDENLKIRTIYSLDWSPDGENIALSFFDKDFRKIGIYNIPSESFFTVSDNTSDDRDPRFSRDGKTLYFSSDRTGIFNIFRISGGEAEQLTNVASGAFAPDICAEETRLIYSAYTADGFKIFKTEISPPSQNFGIVLSEREPLIFTRELISGSRTNYSYIPRKWIVIPTIISEAVITENRNHYRGIQNLKYGAVVGVMDPLFWSGKGNMLTAFYLTGSLSEQISALFTLNRPRNRLVPYDFGAIYESRIFPIDISLLYFTRNIPLTDEFIHNLYGPEVLVSNNVAIQPSMVQLSLTKPIMTRFPTTHFTPGIFTSFTNFRQSVRIDDRPGTEKMDFLWFDPANLFRVGGLLSYGNMPRYSASNVISPRGFTAQFQYDFNHGNFANTEEVIRIEDGRITNNNESYNFNAYKLSLFWGRPSWLISEKVDFALQFNASAVHETRSTAEQIRRNHAENPRAFPNDLPDFFFPAQKVPGYSFSYRASSTEQVLHDSNGVPYKIVEISQDSLVASNKVLLELHGSYRFPLTRSEGIARRFWIFYFDKLYGAVNFGGVMPSQSLRELQNKTIDDALLYAGAELRLSTITFNNYPLAFALRYDYGISRRAPVGGSRFALNVGFEFGNGMIISQPNVNRYVPEIIRNRVK